MSFSSFSSSSSSYSINDILPKEILGEIFTWLNSDNTNNNNKNDVFFYFEHETYKVKANGWSQVMLTCHLWNQLGRKIFNPTLGNNAPIRWASYKGYMNIVRVLLSDPRVNPAGDHNGPIRWESKYIWTLGCSSIITFRSTSQSC